MMVNARPCALVTHRALGVDLSSGVERRQSFCAFGVATIGCASKTLLHSESNGCAMELNPVRIERDASCDFLDTRTHFLKF